MHAVSLQLPSSQWNEQQSLLLSQSPPSSLHSMTLRPQVFVALSHTSEQQSSGELQSSPNPPHTGPTGPSPPAPPEPLPLPPLPVSPAPPPTPVPPELLPPALVPPELVAFESVPPELVPPEAAPPELVPPEAVPPEPAPPLVKLVPPLSEPPQAWAKATPPAMVIAMRKGVFTRMLLSPLSRVL